MVVHFNVILVRVAVRCAIFWEKGAIVKSKNKM